MSKIIARLLEDVRWLDELSAILTVFFVIMFVLIVIRVLSWKKAQVEEYKNIPFIENDSDTV